MFVALELPAATHDALVSWQRDLLALCPDELRAARPDSLHVTLAFLGYRPQRDATRIAAALEQPVRASDSIELGFADRLAPRPARKPRFYAAPLESTPPLQDFRAAVAGCLTAAELFEDERRDFWPHVTLCRVKSAVRAHYAPAGLPAAPAALAGQTFTATRVTLYSSELLPQGAQHTPLAKFALGGGVSDAT